ncbi:hypothetical protein GBAR_LOCUS27075 [Geodia barretti]|uniref:Uncharacterized protein n=1 Tax=Geodia barretti TaxID=519541 RepID=A0AA35TK53_GEOBA|nr:hypothetical protein GBAR_LOCUS27075 [Geodia barretti]
MKFLPNNCCNSFCPRNSQIAIIPQKNQQPRFTGRAVLGEESRTKEDNTSRLTTNQQRRPTQVTEEHLVRKPQLHVEYNAGRNTTRRKYLRRPPDIPDEAMMDNDSPCNSMRYVCNNITVFGSYHNNFSS